jgi:hypothetical protein
VLSVDDFVADGFVRIEGAFSPAVAAECRDALWEQLPETPGEPDSWQRPVARIGYQAGGCFEASVNTEALRVAFDALVGAGRWMARSDVGTFAVRFPSSEAPGDDGWHIDSSFPPLDPADHGDPFAWRVNVASRGRCLLMLMLFSDVDQEDAPTRLRRGSHRATARLLAPHGEEGLTMIEASQRAAEATASHDVALATGRAGDVYLCHPFLVHAAQGQSAGRPRFLAQPPLHPVGWIASSLDIRAGTAPVEAAIRSALA